MKKLFKQIIKFGILGGFCTLIEWGIFYITNEFIFHNYFVSTFIAYSFSTIVNYYYSVKWVFKVKEESRSKKNFYIFIILSIFGLLLNELFMYIFIEKFKLLSMISKILSTILVMIYNFISRKILLGKDS